MEKEYELSETEYEIMEYFWSIDHPVQFKDVLTYFNMVKQKDWKKQTLGTYLKFLQDKGFLQVDDSAFRKKYAAAYDKELYLHNQAVEICQTSFDNSIGKFVAAFSGGKKLDDKSIQELKEYLKRYE